MTTEPKKKRGGYREGGGRPKGVSQTPKSFRIDDDLARYLEEKVGNQNAFINMLIRNYKEQSKGIIEAINKLSV